MRQQRSKFEAELEEQKLQADMVYQLQLLKDRLREEQTRNAKLEEAKEKHEIAAASTNMRARQRTASSSNVVMADAGGMIEILQEDCARLRRERDEAKVKAASLRSGYDKAMIDREMASAGFHVKFRQQEEAVRDSLRIVHGHELDNFLCRYVKKINALRSWKANVPKSKSSWLQSRKE